MSIKFFNLFLFFFFLNRGQNFASLLAQKLPSPAQTDSRGIKQYILLNTLTHWLQFDCG